MRREEIFVVSKPLGPPWNDSGKNLVRAIVANLTHEQFRVFVPRGARLGLEHVEEEEIHCPAASFAPPFTHNLRLFARLMKCGRRAGIYHFFFAPNARSSRAARLLMRLKKSVCVQNISSRPKSFDRIGKLVFGDRIVVHSDLTRRLLEESGVGNVVRIYPGIELPSFPAEERRKKALEIVGGAGGPLILYPGDYSFSGAIPAVTGAIPAVLASEPGTRFVLACRIKTPPDRDYERRMLERLEREGVRRAVAIINEAPDFHALAALCDLAVFPALSLYAKMDIPLALIECLALGKPLIVSDIPPLNEVLKPPACAPVPPGDPQALSRAIIEIIGSPGRMRTMSNEARRAAGDHFDIRKLAPRYAEIYDELRHEANL